MSYPPPTNRDIDEWQVWLWNLPDELLSRPQKLQFQLMLSAAFNAFDPYLIIPELLAQRDLWQGVVMDRGFLLPGDFRPALSRLATDLIKLRDIAGGHWNVDTLFILTQAGHEAKWQEVTKHWKVDEMGYIEGDEASRLLGVFGGPESVKILTLWWD